MEEAATAESLSGFRRRETLRSHFNAMARLAVSSVPLYGTLCWHFGSAGAVIGLGATIAIYAAAHLMHIKHPEQVSSEPLPDTMGPLQQTANEYAKHIGLKKQIPVVMGDNRRFKDADAWTLNDVIYFQHKAQTTVPDYEDKSWIIAHELGHIVNQDDAKGMAFMLSLCATSAAIAVSQASMTSLSPGSIAQHITEFWASLLAVGVYTGLSFIAQTRSSEYAADRIAYALTGNTKALEKIIHQYGEQPGPEILSSHPMRYKRVAYTASLDRKARYSLPAAVPE